MKTAPDQRPDDGMVHAGLAVGAMDCHAASITIMALGKGWDGPLSGFAHQDLRARL